MTFSRGPVFARTLIEELGGPRDPGAIASELHLEVREVTSSGFDGALVRPTNLPIGTILLRDSIRESGRKAFTIAHEIGHFVLPGHEKSELVCTTDDIGNWSDDARKLEREADEFAAELLMPLSVVQPIVRAARPSISVIEKIAEVGNASLSAAAWRYCDVTSERCAVVWSTRRIVSWSKRSTEFGHWIPKGAEVQRGTFAFDCFSFEPVPNEPQSIEASLWLESATIVPGARLQEQSRFLPSYESVVSLLWIDQRIERNSGEEALEELDPSEFTTARKRWPSRK
jgi:IrrE N-terminal-like domain